MNVKVAIPALAICALAAAAAPAGANPSCVGQFASQSGEHVGEFSALISEQAHTARPFGTTLVAPFAHAPREACP